ncbi:MAG: four helix bundle protein [Gemmatimonadota bacterium]
MQDYHDLLVWQKAHALALRVDTLAELLVRRNRANLASQMRRASMSISSNIAEGCSRSSPREFARFLQIAIASSTEVQYQAEFVVDARILPPNETERLSEHVVEVRRMLYGLLKRLRASPDFTDSKPPTQTANKKLSTRRDSKPSTQY